MTTKIYPREIIEELKQVDELTDKLGLPVDEGVKPLVAALRAYGFNTVDSCEGHEDRRTHGPRVWITSKEYENLTSEWDKLDRKSEESRRLVREIEAVNLRDRSYLIDLLDEFYEGRDTSAWIRIIIETRALSTCVLICQGTAVADALYSDRKREAWLKFAKQEFSAFTDFLVDRVGKGECIPT